MEVNLLLQEVKGRSQAFLNQRVDKKRSWSKHPHVLQKYVDNFRKSRKYKLLTPAPLEPVPTKSVIYKYYKGISSHEKETGNRLTVEEYIKCYRKPVGNQSKTLTIDQRQRVNNIIVRRDARSFPMGRKEVLNFIAEVSGKSFKAAANHYNYLVRKKLLKDLKRGGRVVAAQKTTTKRSQVTIEQQHRWHQTIDLAWETQAEKNEPKEEFKKLRAHFHGNTDESCVLGSEGTLKVVSSIFKKTESNKDDFRGSLTMIRTGTAARGNGPVIFLCKGEKELIPPSLRGDLSDKFGLPAGSCVIPTPSAYMYRLKKASLLELLTEMYLSMEQEAAAAGPTEE